LANDPVLTAIAFSESSVSLPSSPSVQPFPNHAPWQVAPVSATGRAVAIALALLAVDSVFTWSATPYLIVAVCFTVIPAVVAVRVIRGFHRSRELAAATFAVGLAVASIALFQPGLGAGQASPAILVAIALGGSGLLTLAVAEFRNRLSGEPVIAIPRWPAIPVALRSPSRYRTHRQYR
jgi:hypothetical protein